ncbi:flagellar biosynthesis protein FlhF [Burkholderia thailandensis 34]|uniref:flagellar biosynthesis protein FlhF n=1 Tax=Burkholderia thailandensis TaxID=57975 RepID=UPI0005D83405|nr:flagellar biosynthesis protein FlhF [Burkholderia thailandensis]AJY29876.1 flagellar biosynthesis protein FlhF [Burkholderia thailandensis 34]AOJ55284.1 flagellar biosynthesis protein FlhF [Burkholderia thailandensis]KXF60714.1 flagellar biosynthesis protein FlhF [Burkholderia thailandensis]PNE75228.1 flagellar biosynthesis protein FlhF [Burkholderia thailandensis]
MNIRKFIGPTSRDALRLVREAMGADAAVLSNRTLEDGRVEIVALPAAELAEISTRRAGDAAAHGAAQPHAPRPGAQHAPAGPSFASPAASVVVPSAAALAPASRAAANPYATGGMPDVFSSVFGASVETSADDDAPPAVSMPAPPAQPAAAPSEPAPWLVEHAKRLTKQHEELVARPRAASTAPHAPRERAAADEAPEWARDIVRNAARRLPADEPSAAKPALRLPEDTAAVVADAVKARIERIVNDTVMQELGSLRELMEEQFAGLMWNERQRRNPVHGALTKYLFAAGFSAQLVRMIVDNLPEGEGYDTLDAAADWAQSVLAANLPVLDSEDALMERGGVFALMGPTGVGKTTTTAKLAARCVMRFGASKVALLTTDSYRIGGHEQLRIFGKILGVPVHAVKDGGDLQLALAELRNKHMVLIDTIGMSQRDRTVSDQIAMLHGADTPVQRLLLLNATSHGDTLNEVVQAYRSAAGQPRSALPDLAGCILTKLDEASNLGGVLDTVIRYKLPVHYVSTGQKVPENLYVATKKFLLKSAFCAPREDSPFVPHDDDLPAMLSALSARTGNELHEVRFG